MLACPHAVADRAGTASRTDWVRQLERLLVRHRHRLPWVHAVMLAGFLVLILVPLALPDPPESATPFTHFTPFAGFMLWGLWFPLVLLSVLLTGRSWCGLMCPMGAASEWLSRRGCKRPAPRWLRWEGMPVMSFLLITVLGQTLGVRDHPEAVAEIFGGTLFIALLVGCLYAGRAWCRYLCPIGLLLGVFARLSIVQLAPKSPMPGPERRRSARGICPTFIDIPRKKASRHCIECLRCVNPQAKGGLQLQLRAPGSEIRAIDRHDPKPAELAFLFLGGGAALGAFLWLAAPLYGVLRQRIGEWLVAHGGSWVGDTGPWWLMSVHPARREVFNWLDFITISGFIAVVALLLCGVLTGAAAAGARLAGPCGVRRRTLHLGYGFAPVAMVSLLVGLGGDLFEPLRALAVDAATGALQSAMVAAAVLWSIHLCHALLGREPLAPARRNLALIPPALASAAFGWLWFQALSF